MSWPRVNCTCAMFRHSQWHSHSGPYRLSCFSALTTWLWDVQLELYWDSFQHFEANYNWAPAEPPQDMQSGTGTDSVPLLASNCLEAAESLLVLLLTTSCGLFFCFRQYSSVQYFSVCRETQKYCTRDLSLKSGDRCSIGEAAFTL